MTSATPLLRFTPRAVPHADLEAVFIKRHHLVDKAISSVHELADGGGVHHHLFIGPRGVGKTHLMAIIAHRLNADPKLANRVVVAWLDEDPWVVRDYASLIEHIADTASLHGVSDGASLLNALAGRCLVVVAENLDDIFARIETDGQHALRGLIENSRSIMILGAAVARFEDMSEHDRPFFGSFEVEDLTEFSVDEAAELLRLVAERDGDSELAAFLESPHAKSRLKVVEALAGGHPRVWMLLAGCLSIEAIDELVPLFLRSLDDLTPYYQERLRSLAKGHLSIVMTLCGNGLMGALPVGDIAKLSKVSEKSAPQLLDQLVEKGFVRFVRADGVPGIGDGRVRYYELREPLLRLSVQMKRTKGQLLGLVVQFLRTWHGVELLSATRIPVEGTLARSYVEAAVRESEFLSSTELYTGTPAQLRERAEGMRLLGTGEGSAGLVEAYADYKDGSFDASIERFETAIRTLPSTNLRPLLRAQLILSLAYLHVGRYEEAVVFLLAILPQIERVLPDDPINHTLRNNLANALNTLDRHLEAVEVIEPAANTDPVFAFTLFESCFLQGELSRASEAFRSGMRTQDAQPSNSVEFLFDETAEQMLRKDPRLIVPWLVREFEATGALDELGAGLLRALPKFLSVAGSRRASEWAVAWRHETADRPQMAIPVQVLTALTTWWETRQRKSLLSLPPELRDIAVPLAEKAIALDALAQTK
jgi:tetratricopeptide (TPR) repeat protein/DNA-binding MarR family transcriptional regulator